MRLWVYLGIVTDDKRSLVGTSTYYVIIEGGGGGVASLMTTDDKGEGV